MTILGLLSALGGEPARAAIIAPCGSQGGGCIEDEALRNALAAAKSASAVRALAQAEIDQARSAVSAFLYSVRQAPDSAARKAVSACLDGSDAEIEYCVASVPGLPGSSADALVSLHAHVLRTSAILSTAAFNKMDVGMTAPQWRAQVGSMIKQLKESPPLSDLPPSPVPPSGVPGMPGGGGTSGTSDAPAGGCPLPPGCKKVQAVNVIVLPPHEDDAVFDAWMTNSYYNDFNGRTHPILTMQFPSLAGAMPLSGSDVVLASNYKKSDPAPPPPDAPVVNLRNQLLQIKKDCKIVKGLQIYGHGGPSAMLGWQLNYAALDKLFGDLTCVMAKDADVGLHGCNTGYGCMGYYLMTGISDRLLAKGGGRVFASSGEVGNVGVAQVPENLTWKSIHTDGGSSSEIKSDHSGGEGDPANVCTNDLAQEHQIVWQGNPPGCPMDLFAPCIPGATADKVKECQNGLQLLESKLKAAEDAEAERRAIFPNQPFGGNPAQYRARQTYTDPALTELHRALFYKDPSMASPCLGPAIAARNTDCGKAVMVKCSGTAGAPGGVGGKDAGSGK